MKTIIAVGLKDKEGSVFIGLDNETHSLLIARLISDGYFAPETYSQGFICSEERFYSREEAFHIAKEAKQIISNKTFGFLEYTDLWEKKTE